MLRELLILLVIISIGAIAGFYTARLAADMPALSGAVQSGPWRVWPDAGVADAMPYARLRYYLDGALPPSPVDRLEVLAEEDDEGKALSTNCEYELRGRMLPVRHWMLAAHVQGDKTMAFSVLQASDVIHGRNGEIVIRLSRQPVGGNWLHMPPRGPVRLVLHMLGISPLERERILSGRPFTISRGRCS